MSTSRTDFNESWLCEMPMGTGAGAPGMFNIIKSSLHSFTNCVDKKPTNLENGYRKIFGTQVAYYWHVDVNNEIDIAVELTVTPQSVIVNAVCRRDKSSSYASDLYATILKDLHKSIILVSDNSLSDDGFKLWKRLFSLGYSISLYDAADPGRTFNTFSTIDEMHKFFKVCDKEFKKWQYVVSDSDNVLAETISFFNTRRMRELCSMGTDD